MVSNKIPEFKSIFKEELRNLIIYKRNCGLKYDRTNIDMCRKLDEYFTDIQLNEKVIDYKIYDQWMKTIKTHTASTRLRYHSAMASFCDYLRINSYENIIQPETPNITYKGKFIPYIFNNTEIERIFTILSEDITKNSDDGYIFYPEPTREKAKTCDYYYFHSVLKRAKIPVRYDGKRQRIHDLRHTFCIHALKQMEDREFDLYVSISMLSVYLGHKHLHETKYYLRMVKSEGEKMSNEAQQYINLLYDNSEEYYNGD